MIQTEINDFPLLLGAKSLSPRDTGILELLTEDKTRLLYPVLVETSEGVQQTVMLNLNKEVLEPLILGNNPLPALMYAQDHLIGEGTCLKVAPITYMGFTVTVIKAHKVVHSRSLWLDIESIVWLIKFIWYDDYSFEAIKHLRPQLYDSLSHAIKDCYQEGDLVLLSTAESALRNLVDDTFQSKEVCSTAIPKDGMCRHVVVTVSNNHILVHMESYKGMEIFNNGDVHLDKEHKEILCERLGSYRNKSIIRALTKFWEGEPLTPANIFGKLR